MSGPAEPPASHAATPDPHGQAALLLVESLMHGLVARRVLSVADAVEFLEVALDSHVAMAETGRSLTPTAHLLETLLRSMEIDLPRA